MAGNIFDGWKASDYPTEAMKQIDKVTDLLKSSTEDMVNHPSHYTSGSIECIDAMIETQGIEAVKGYCKCNAFKYLWRHAFKNGEEDIDKAVWYLNKYVELRDETKSEEVFENDRGIKTPTPSSYNGAFCSKKE